ncbi:MAG: hypothetical protein JO167_11525, partial [Alphaproteobacteria bacterium]|nr:hypothetical protein [Alphaproteobacteria bacterium]
ADGELPPEEMTRVAAIVEMRPDLRAVVERHYVLRQALGSAFEPMLNAPIPAALVETVKSAPASWRVRAGQLLSGFTTARTALPAGLALALGLVVGIGLDRPASPVLTTPAGTMVARGTLSRALDTQLAADGEKEGTRIGVSFRNARGQDCRTFTLHGAGNDTSGLACRSAQSWGIAALAVVPRDATSGAPYQMAGSAMPDAIRSAVSGMIAGAPYDAAAERRALSRNWQGNSTP